MIPEKPREYLNINNPADIQRLRDGIDPENIWYTDDELRKIMMVAACDLEKTVIRCFLGIQQKAKAKKDVDNVLIARIRLNRFECGFLTI